MSSIFSQRTVASWIIILCMAACGSQNLSNVDTSTHDVSIDIPTQDALMQMDARNEDLLADAEDVSDLQIDVAISDLETESIEDSTQEGVTDAVIPQTTIVEAFPSLIFSQPTDIQHAPDGTNRLFVVEKERKIQVFENEPLTTTKTEFLDISSLVTTYSEAGLLGLAFHPNYAVNGTFFVNYIKASPYESVIARYQVSSDPNKADAMSGEILFKVARPQANHGGGQIAFGPDGDLYIALGDGGIALDPDNYGQRLDTLLGKIVRIDVDTVSPPRNYAIPVDNPFAADPHALPEIFAYGFRNPWRFSFDPVTTWLWVADVGQYDREEISVVEKGKNYGWNVMEGTICLPPQRACNVAGLELPVIDYDRSEGYAIIGGYVYRGTTVENLKGRYIYGDFGSGKIWSLGYDGINLPDNQLVEDTDDSIFTFGVDQYGEIYYGAYDGKIRKLQ